MRLVDFASGRKYSGVRVGSVRTGFGGKNGSPASLIDNDNSDHSVHERIGSAELSATRSFSSQVFR